MARRTRQKTMETDESIIDGVESEEEAGESMLDGMPEGGTGDAPTAVAEAERPQVPKELRSLFNEIGRLSGFLSLARRAVYANNPSAAMEALEVLEEQVPAARKIAKISAE